MSSSLPEHGGKACENFTVDEGSTMNLLFFASFASFADKCS